MTIRPYGLCYLNTDDNDLGIFMYMYKRLLSKYDRRQLHDMLDGIIEEHGCLFGRALAVYILFQEVYGDEVIIKWR